MDRERTRIAEDLRGVVSGDVLCDDASLAAYAADASLWELRPLAVVRPWSPEDVAATVRWAAANGVPVHARGGGTSVCGGALGRGVVVDCSRHLRRIQSLAADTVRVEAGVVCTRLEQRLAAVGRTFGPDPSNAAVTTVGGMIGRNASGSRFPRHGAVAGRILAAEVVTADGSIVEWTPVAAEDAEAGPLAPLAAGLTAILDDHRETIATCQPPTRGSHGGYRLAGLRHDGVVDLPRLLCGAEGTLGIVTAASFRTVPADGPSAVALVLFASLAHAAEAALRLRPLGPSACDLFDRRHLALARGTKPAFDLLIPAVAEAGLLVEFTADATGDPGPRLDKALALLSRGRPVCLDVRRAEDAADAAVLWDLSRRVVSTLHGVRAEVRPVPYVEDIVIPPDALPEFLRRLEDALKACQMTAMLFGHAAHGQMHVRAYADPRSAADQRRLEDLATALYPDVVALGGTIGGELGLGLSRTGHFARLFPEFATACADVKRLLDPAGLLNPGRVVPAAAAAPAFRPSLRAAAAVEPAADAPTQPAAPVPHVVPLPLLSWSPDTLAAEVDACNGCGGCRANVSGERMCPRYRLSRGEEASPRAKAAAAAAILSGRIDPKAVSSEMLRTLADTCFNCHQCRVDCAAGVDVPALVTELKAAHFAAHATPFTPWLLSRVDTLSAVGGRLRPLANWALGNPQTRWLLEHALGIAQGRKLPPFTGRQFLAWAARRGLTKPSRRGGPRVLLFLDTYARRHDPLLAQALVAVLEHHGVGVFVDPRQVAAGMPLVSEGDVDGARRLARRNVRVLAEAVRLGYRVVSPEPAAVTCLRHDYPLLLEDEEVDRIAAATCDATSYLWELHREGGLRLDFRPVAATVLYHAPCHARAAAGGPRGADLLRLVPGLTVDDADRGCSGMAGTFGLSRGHYRESLRIGRTLVSAVRDGICDAGATECSACKIQMEQGTSKPTVHPVKILAKAYGLLPGRGGRGLDELFTARSGPLTTT